MLILPAPEPVTYTAMNYVGNNNSEILILIQRLQKQITVLGNNPPHNPHDPLESIVIHQRSNVSKYCWYHGSFDRTSRYCTSKRKGYKYDTIFSNKIIGSMYYCQAVAVNPYLEST